jgi:hypothetical protein
MTKASKIDPIFTAGTETDPHDKNPYIWSSTNWMVFETGQHWQNCGFGRHGHRVVLARKSRGYSVRVNTCANEWAIKFTGDALTPAIERI